MRATTRYAGAMGAHGRSLLCTSLWSRAEAATVEDAMEQKAQVALLERLLARLDADAPEMADLDAEIPARNYVSPERAAEETKALFRKLPLVFGHAARLSSPGAFVTWDGFGLPILATRDRDGALR